jgi:outer membrane receptor protein involved in Fe transport
MNAYVQSVVRKQFGTLYTMRVSAKAGYDDIYYTSSWGDSEYGQTELQLNSSHLFRICRWFNMSLAADIQWDNLASTSYSASRLTTLSALTASFSFERLLLNIAAEYSGCFDRNHLARHALSPSMDFRLHLIDGLDVTGFGRRAYRVPMFNELYYVGYGNPDLLPEDAWLTDLGVDFKRQLTSSWAVKAKVDGFYNFLSNKITSAPVPDDPNIWLPYNIGKVRSAGFDLVAGTDYESGDWRISMDARYSLLSAVDRTSGQYTYGQQIPYVAKHTVTADLKASWKGYVLNPRWVMKSGRTDGNGSLADWNNLDMSLSKRFMFKKVCSLSITLAAKNLLDARYELVSGYPMPGRSFIAGLELDF